ncbi:MAG: hypothetical protein AAB726_03205 [Patescibacteria group bacterium]
MAKNKAPEFLRQYVRGTKRSFENISKEMKTPCTSLRAWISRARFPAEALERFGTIVNVSVAELKKRGVTISRSRTSPVYVSGMNDLNIVAVIQEVAAAKPDSVTLHQLIRLVEVRKQLNGDLTPELVLKLLEQMSPTKK